MGVKGLWSLLNPVARPVQIESLENKRLAIDSSIWLYQFQSTMRDKDGRVLVNAHVLGFLRRINKLLFHGIKPVFVFDGGAPALKRSTIAERKRKKAGAAFNATKMAEKLLQAQMRREALRLAQQAGAARGERDAQGTYEDEGGESIPANAVYLDQLEGRPGAAASRAMPDDTEEDERASRARKRKKFEKKDRYYLPDTTIPQYSTDQRPDARLATEDELRQFMDEVNPEDIDVESPEFRALPTEVQYEIIGDLRVKSRQQSHKRLMEMLSGAPTALDFSKAQIKRLNQRNALTQQLLSVTDMVGKAHLTIPIRVAAERNRQYILVKRDDGSGWALGIREGTKDRPIVLEPETEQDRIKKEEDMNASASGSDYDYDSDDYDSQVEEYKPPPDDELRQHRRREILQAITTRYAPANTKPSLDVPITPFGTARAPGAVPLFDTGEDMHGPDRAELDPADAETKVTANDEALALTLQREELGEDENEADPELARALALSRATGRVSKSVSAEPIPVELPSSEDEFEEIALVPSGSATPAPEPIVVDDSEDEDDFELVEVAPKSKTQPQLAALLKGSIPVASSSRAANLIAQARPQVPQPRIQPLQEPTPPQQYIAPLPDSSDSDEFEEVPTPVLSRSASRPREPGHAPAPAPAPAPEPESEPAGFQLPRRREAPRPRRNLTQLIQMARPKSPEREPELESEPDAGPALRYPSLEAEPERRRGAPSPSPEAAFIDDGPFAGMQVRRRAPSPPSPSPPAEISVPKRQLEPDDEPEDFEPEEDELTLQNSLEPTLQNNAARPYDLDSEEEDDDAIEWSRSPTPQPRTADTSTSLQRAYSSAQSLMSEPRDDDDDEMAPADMVNEEDDYARFLAQIKNRDLNEVREEIDDEIRVLNNQAKAAIRDSDEITQSMVSQIQTLLRHFGIPYITAPMEAEAQCAKLAELGLVDGVITDDSDVFLFGAVQCFKNIFNDAKFAECFLASDIERELSLTRERLVSLSYLLGSDYTLGLTGVGPVLALELLANFPGPDGLVNFRQWWLRVQTATDSEEEADTKWKKAFKKRFASTLQLSPIWPDPLVREAYLHPTADESDEPFHWGFPRLAALRTYLHEELSWSISKVDDELTPIVQRIAKRGKGSISAQTTLLPYFDHAVTGAMSVSYAPRRRTTANLSKRLMSVIKAFREAEAGASVAWGEMLAGVDENDPKGSGVGKSTGKGKGKAKEGEGGVGEGEGEGEDTGESEGTRKGKRKAAAKGKAKGRGKSIASTEAEENGEAEDADADAQPKPRKKPAKRAAKRKPADEDTYGSDPEAAPKRRRVTRTATGSSATPATEGE